MLYEKLYDWQKQIVDELSKKSSFGLWLDCGLGKTVQALALAEKTGARKILVVTPNAKACETIDTPGSWHYWASQLGSDWRIVSKKDKAPVSKKKQKELPEVKANDNSKPPYKSGGTTMHISARVSSPSNMPVQQSQITFNEYEKACYIINYEGLVVHGGKSSRPILKPEILAFIASCRHSNTTLLLDESHYIKDSSSQQAKALKAIKRELMCMSDILHTYLLTGTPFTRGFIDVLNQLQFLGCPMTKTEFREHYCVLGNVRGLLGWQQPIVGYRNTDELYKLIHKYAITIKSDDVIKLPEQVFMTHYHKRSPWFDLLTKPRMNMAAVLNMNELRANCGLPYVSQQDFGELNNPFERLIDVWCEEHHRPVGSVSLQDAVKQKLSVQNPWFRNIDWPSTKYQCDTAGTLWLRSRQLSIGFQGNAEECIWLDDSRIELLKEFLINNPDNYVLFYNYMPEFISLYEICTELGYHVDVYNGEIKSLTNYERYSHESDIERENDTKNIILSNFASGSTGMNWQLYSSCIIFSLPTYKHWAQGLKRVHRVGAQKTVQYHVFRSDSWLDDGMMKALEEHTEYSEDMFNKELNLVNNL